MQASVVSGFEIDEIKRVAKLFCLFEDVIDNLEFESELASPDKFPPVESVRHNMVLQDMDDDAVMEAIDDAEDVSCLRILLVPYIDTPGLSYASTYKMHLLEHTWTTQIVFNSHPTTTCGDTIVRFMDLMVKFVQYALDHDDETIENCEPKMEIFFGEIIRDEKLAQYYDPRRSRTTRRGAMSGLSSPASSLDGSCSETAGP
ncbi:hypothetical protein CERSUDRAFT_92103 [Gelatoporia subvermispora B]|uniref:Uncharacterized protein n=1 Tax=Ceriporiopsis subvermispora (strain B) TaxID=914234 RepID=M2R4V8_CERS8|nr:hypothetical protein CERSUDRAFT_92103 [Gelatoporia subvermispora B]